MVIFKLAMLNNQMVNMSTLKEVANNIHGKCVNNIHGKCANNKYGKCVNNSVNGK